MAGKTEDIFQKSGALLKGHFLLTSGLHSPAYWEKFRILQFPGYTEQLCRMIADHFRRENVQVVAGPTTGGIILAFEVARQLGVRGIFAEKEDEERNFRRGFSIDPGERVLIVDDILTTGSSVHEVIAAVNKLGGNIIGIGVLVDRSGQAPDFGFPLFSCHRAATVTYRPEECPLCAAGVPLVKPGSSQPPA
ncbi:MAG: orotate phosphoribosyltransferase [Dehalococcoidia bacterium]|jgi:orotate phosphoribosyltransferase|nr:orotate phosphoribosyltransferase [Dehalococcoidia bacterium]